MIRRLSAIEATDACQRLTDALPDWFGIPEANAAYIDGVSDCHCLGEIDATGVCRGLVALRPHYGTTLEIWWMAVDPLLHRRGIGTALVAAAVEEARSGGFLDIMLMTLSDESDDPGYAATRAFYVSQGFRPLVRDHIGDGANPLMWMIRPVRAEQRQI